MFGEQRWDAPLRLLGGLHFLLLGGELDDYVHADDPWAIVRPGLTAHFDWLSEFVRTQPVQTNEVHRCWALLIGFLTAAQRAGKGRPVSLLELGPSAGLLLLFDHYRYRFGDQTWGPAAATLELAGELHGEVPNRLLDTRIDVAARTGIDRHPVDVTTEAGARLLECFVWADQLERLARLRLAIDVVRDEPPELIEGDYLELLPIALAARDPDALTIVFNSASTAYLRSAEYARLQGLMEDAASRGPLAWVSLEAPRDRQERGNTDNPVGLGAVLELKLWPDGGRERLARVEHHGHVMLLAS